MKPDQKKFYRKNENTGREVFAFDFMANYLIKELNVCKINDTVHVYDNGIYRPGEGILHGHMLKLMPILTDSQRKEVYKYIKVSLDTPTREVSPAHLIPFRSKIYDIDTDSFLDYSPQYVFLNRFPFDYDPAAETVSTVTNTINAISGGDRAVASLIYETFGNCFYLLNQYRGTVFFYGQNGNNGKSTLLNMLIQLVGRENCSFLTIQDMAERFRLVEVYGKAVNVCDDNGDAFIADSSVFKRTSTGGTVTAEKKGQDPITFEPFAKCFFALNNLPAVSDKSKAFFSRVLLIPLNADFSSADNKDTSLKDRKWTEAEMRCLTRLSVEGLKRLRKNGDFTRPECVDAALVQYELDNNPALGFWEERKDKIIGTATDTVYRDFKEWCAGNGYKPFTKHKFSAELKAKRGIITPIRYVACLNKSTRVYEHGTN